MPTWTPKYAVGHPLIDQQHQELFARADALLDAMHGGRAAAELGQLIEFLGMYVVEHFGNEVGLMREHRFPGAAQHEAEHAEFVRRFREATEAHRSKGATSAVVLELRDLLRGWLVTHVCTVDLQLAAFLKAGGAGER